MLSCAVMFIRFLDYRVFAGLICLLLLSPAHAESLADRTMRQLEMFRMQQLSSAQADAELSPFTTDGCSGNLSKSWELLAEQIPKIKAGLGARPPWEDCCVTHDRSYWRGQAADGYDARLAADRAFRQCVVDTGTRLAPEWSVRFSMTPAQIEQGFAVIADWMYEAVRLGGQPCSLLPWRWGYGWPNCAFQPTVSSSLRDRNRMRVSR